MLFQITLVFWCLLCFSTAQTCDSSDDFTLRKNNVTTFRVTPTGDIFGCQDKRNICLALDNGIQNLELNASSLSITNGNSIILPDASSTNEIQTLSISGQLLSLSSSNQVSLPLQSLSLDNSGVLLISDSNNVTLPDPSSTNELQTLSINGLSLSISSSNSISLPVQSLSIDSGGVVYISDSNSITLPDDSAANELQSLSIANGIVSISSGNSILLPDISSTNELQTLSTSSNSSGVSLSISNGNQIALPNPSLSITGGTITQTYGGTTSQVTVPDASATNELQTLSINGRTISISAGNNVVVPGSIFYTNYKQGQCASLYNDITWTFIAPTVTTVAGLTPNMIVTVQGTAGLGVNGIAAGMNFGACYRQTGQTAVQNSNDFDIVQTPALQMRIPYAAFGRFTSLTGSYDFGLCLSVTANSYNYNDWSKMSTIVYIP